MDSETTFPADYLEAAQTFLGKYKACCLSDWDTDDESFLLVELCLFSETPLRHRGNFDYSSTREPVANIEKHVGALGVTQARMAWSMGVVAVVFVSRSTGKLLTTGFLNRDRLVGPVVGTILSDRSVPRINVERFHDRDPDAVERAMLSVRFNSQRALGWCCWCDRDMGVVDYDRLCWRCSWKRTLAISQGALL